MPDPIHSTILNFLKTSGPHLDCEIAEALKIPLAHVRNHVAALSSSGDLICCNSIQFRNGQRIEGLSCRLSCYTPPAARGRKPGAAAKAGAERASE